MVEAKTFSFSTRKGNAVVRLEEKKERIQWIHSAGD